MSVAWWIVLSSVIVVKISLIGSIFFFIPESKWKRFLPLLISFAAGSLIGASFFHLIPETIERMGNKHSVFALIFCGLAFFFLMEKLLHWHRCHFHCEHEKKTKTMGPLILMSDSLHNLVDGVTVAAAFMGDIHLGITTLIVTVLHEIPQEVGDFGALVYSGYSKKKALIFNFISSLTFIIGVLITVYLSKEFDLIWVLPFAAGNFLYIAGSDLIPEIREHTKLASLTTHYAFFIVGALCLYGLQFALEHGHSH
jgi:zinc and cadmium transporter